MECVENRSLKVALELNAAKDPIINPLKNEISSWLMTQGKIT